MHVCVYTNRHDPSYRRKVACCQVGDKGGPQPPVKIVRRVPMASRFRGQPRLLFRFLPHSKPVIFLTLRNPASLFAILFPDHAGSLADDQSRQVTLWEGRDEADVYQLSIRILNFISNCGEYILDCRDLQLELVNLLKGGGVSAEVKHDIAYKMKIFWGILCRRRDPSESVPNIINLFRSGGDGDVPSLMWAARVGPGNDEARMLAEFFLLKKKHVSALGVRQQHYGFSLVAAPAPAPAPDADDSEKTKKRHRLGDWALGMPRTVVLDAAELDEEALQFSQASAARRRAAVAGSLLESDMAAKLALSSFNDYLNDLGGGGSVEGHRLPPAVEVAVDRDSNLPTRIDMAGDFFSDEPGAGRVVL